MDVPRRHGEETLMSETNRYVDFKRYGHWVERNPDRDVEEGLTCKARDTEIGYRGMLDCSGEEQRLRSVFERILHELEESRRTWSGRPPRIRNGTTRGSWGRYASRRRVDMRFSIACQGSNLWPLRRHLRWRRDVRPGPSRQHPADGCRQAEIGLPASALQLEGFSSEFYIYVNSYIRNSLCTIFWHETVKLRRASS